MAWAWLWAGMVLASRAEEAVPAFRSWAPTPPMGWNSWDNFATTITEAQTKAQADYMAAHLKAHGWEYVVVDIQWYEPGAKSHAYRRDAVLTMDEFGRLLPAPNRFPSAADGAGFRPLADYVHGLGLKFGIHLMRGIPRQAVERNLPVKGTKFRAKEVADRGSVCPWNPDMYGVDMTKPGAQAYYDSVFALLASWGVDYVKVDDISRPYHEHEREIEAVRRAIDRAGRPMVLSLSPGETALDAAAHVQRQANLWRISDDFWDRWLALREQFARLEKWNAYRRPGAWPDADMLPLGVLVLGARTTRFTPDEQRTMLTLWSIARAPLMHGGDLTKTDAFTLALLTNDEVIAVDQHSANNRPLFDHDGLIAWMAEVPDSADKYLAVFNTRDREGLTAERAAFRSAVIGRGGKSEEAVDVDLRGARKLFLAIDPTSDGDANDHALWIEPRLEMADGSERRLTELKWTRADALWDQASTEKAPGGGAMSHGGKPIGFGISTNGEARVEYALPEGAVRFRATVAVDDAAVREANGGTVRFLVFAVKPEDESATGTLPVRVALRKLGLDGAVRVRDLWMHEDKGEARGGFAPEVAFHGAALYRLSPK